MLLLLYNVTGPVIALMCFCLRNNHENAGTFLALQLLGASMAQPE